MIVTFYSYKGGVGRTQLAVNVASYLCHYQAKKVLLIDWDLEAPGLHFYFKKDKAEINKGLIELFGQYQLLARGPAPLHEEQLPYFDESYIVNLAGPGQNGGRIDLIAAGRYDDQYSYQVSKFDWFEFYELLDGKAYIEFIKDKLNLLDYDYIFIDSRTGISDYSGICNVQMPELNVLVVAPTNQNFDGCLRVAHSIVSSPYVTSNEFRKPYILPILSRLDRSSERADFWIERFKADFASFINNISPFLLELQERNRVYIRESEFNYIVTNTPDEYIGHTMLEYNKVFSTGENILFNEHAERISSASLSKNYENIANRIRYFNLDYNGETKSHDFTKTSEKVRALLGANDVKKALNLLSDSKHLNADERSILVLLRSRFNNLSNSTKKGIISPGESSLEMNRIIVAILDLVEKVGRNKSW
jgi:hypothetical protein